MKIKFRYLLIGVVVLAFGSCLAKEPEQPTTVVQLNTPEGWGQPQQQSQPDSIDGLEDEGPDTDEVMLLAMQERSADYLAAIAVLNDQVEAEWNLALRCRAAAIAQGAMRDAEKNNTGIEEEVLKRLRAVNTAARARIQGASFHTHDAANFGALRDPVADVAAILMVLQALQQDNPAFPICTQVAGTIPRMVDDILNAHDEMKRTGFQSTPVTVGRPRNGN